jgi:outer membrane protein assembly factor BamB
MVWIHRTTAAIAALTCLGAAMAQNATGPMPVAWRWAESGSAVPSGAPLASGDTVYVGVGGRMYALDRRTGNQVWRYPLAEPLDSNFRTGLAMVGTTLVGSTDGRSVHAVDAATGKMVWQYNSEVPLVGTPVGAGASVVVGLSGGALMALNATTGQPAWEKAFAVGANLIPTLSAWQDNVIYMTSAGEIASLNVPTQRKNWSQRFSRLSSTSAAVVFGDALYVNSGNYVTAMRAVNGGKRWDQRVDGSLAFAPGVSENGVAVVSTDGKVYTFDSTGRPVFRAGIDLESQPVGAPSFVGSFVAVGTTNGSLNILDPRSGDTVFNYIVPPIVKGMKVTVGGSGGGGGTGLAGAGGASGGGGTEQEVRYVPLAGPAVLVNGTLMALVRDGSLIAFDKQNGVDLTEPSVAMVWPNSGDQISSRPPMEFWFTVSDSGSGVRPDSLKVTINGQNYGYEWRREGYLIVKISSATRNKPLTDGRQEIVVTGSDWLGNTVEAKFAVTVDSAITNALGGPRRPADQQGGGGPGSGAGGGGGGARAGGGL